MHKDNTLEVFFALVRDGLWGKADATFGDALNIKENVGWEKVYRLAQEQSVQGLVLGGLEYSGFKPPKELLLQWIGEVQTIESRNKEMNAFVNQLIGELHRDNIDTLIVKGQGVAQCYERPFVRVSGDIDLYLNEINFQKAKEFFRTRVDVFNPDNDHAKHINMHYGDWVVEIHADQKCSLSPRINRVMNDVHRDLFFDGKVRIWQNQGTQIYLPSADNDIIIVFTHFLKHFYKGGVGLRQLCDWCRLLYTYRDSLDYILLEQRLRKAGLMDEWRAFGAFSVEYLGLPIEAIPFYIDSAKWQRKANRISEFILEVGNFGHNRGTSYYRKYSFLVRKAISFDRRLKDLIRHAKIFPMDSVRFFFGIMYNGIVSAIKGE